MCDCARWRALLLTFVFPWCQHVYLWGINLGFNRGSLKPRWIQTTNATPSVLGDTFTDKSNIKLCGFSITKGIQPDFRREPIGLIIALSLSVLCELWCIYQPKWHACTSQLITSDIFLDSSGRKKCHYFLGNQVYSSVHVGTESSLSNWFNLQFQHRFSYVDSQSYRS